MPVVNPDFNATTQWSGGGFDQNNPYGDVGGGYDPNSGYVGNSNSTGGDIAVSKLNDVAPSYAGGYYGDQTAGSGGGYDPVTGLNQSDSVNSIGGSAAISQDYNVGMGGVVADFKSSPAPDDPEGIRLASTGLDAGGGNSGGAKQATPVTFASDPGTAAADKDWRVRIALNNGSKIFYKDPNNTLMKPLTNTNGVVFPYTPTINVTHQASYSSTMLTHSNYAMQFYQGSDVSDITISGEFTVQDAAEGKYLLAAIYFFRAATKMFFGFDKVTGMGAGNPPPLVYLNGYGAHYFPNVPCVLTSFNHQLPPDVDYIEIPVSETTTSTVTTNFGSVQGMVAGKDFPSMLSSGAPTGQTTQSTSTVATTSTKTTRLPTSSTISITLRPVYSRKSLHEKFNLDDFASGKLIGGSGSFL